MATRSSKKAIRRRLKIFFFEMGRRLKKAARRDTNMLDGVSTHISKERVPGEARTAPLSP